MYNHDAPADRFLLPLEDSISRTTIKDADPRSQRCAALRCGAVGWLCFLRCLVQIKDLLLLAVKCL